MRKICFIVTITLFISISLINTQDITIPKNTSVHRNTREVPQNIKVTENKEDMSQKAAELLVNKINTTIKKNGKVVICFATGGTPTELYKLLRTKYKDKINWDKVVTFNLDEYVGLSSTHSQSYRYYMDKHLFNHVSIPEENINFLNGKAKNLKEECKQYEKKINEAGGIDITILGIGRNGHIAFNEPGSSFDSNTRKIKLKESTIKANSRFFESKKDVPKYALTMGLNTIHSQSHQILLLATGKKKAKAIKDSLYDPINRETPASLLQHHSKVTYVIDKKAASKLTLK